MDLKTDLDNRVKKYENEIRIASNTENVNIRGRTIEYLSAGDDGILKTQLIEEINDEYSK